jgi:hypothetical protein
VLRIIVIDGEKFHILLGTRSTNRNRLLYSAIVKCQSEVGKVRWRHSERFGAESDNEFLSNCLVGIAVLPAVGPVPAGEVM